MPTKKAKKAITPYEVVATHLIKMLRKVDVSSHQCPFACGPKNGSQRNAITDRPYSGINAMVTLFSDFEDARWLTHKQVTALGGSVLKGETATPIIHVMTRALDEEEKEAKKDKANDSGTKFIGMKYFNIFNVEQTDLVELGLVPDVEPIPYRPDAEAHGALDDIFTILNVDMRESTKARAYYAPSTDHIHIPMPALFRDDASYYATKLHELGHWTGGKARLNRSMAHKFGTAGYALEELVAETFSYMMMDYLNMRPAKHDEAKHFINNQVTYMKSWLDVLEADMSHVMTACSQAHKAALYVIKAYNAGIQDDSVVQLKIAV